MSIFSIIMFFSITITAFRDLFIIIFFQILACIYNNLRNLLKDNEANLLPAILE
jgi:hypothetical protein